MSAEVDDVKGGWGWLLLPLLMMVVGSNAVFGVFMATGGDVAAASSQTNWTLVTSVTAGIGEEVYFRGFLFHRLSRLGRLPLLLVTSLSFSLWHVAPNMLLHTFAVGLLFGGVYAVTGRLFPVIVAHVATDFIGGGGMLLGYW